jgi:hypothetical protein
MKYQWFKDRHHLGGYDPEMLNPDSAIEDLGTALLEETISVDRAFDNAGDLLAVIRRHMKQHEIDQDGLAYLAGLWTLAAALKSADKRIHRLLAEVEALEHDPAVIAARAEYMHEPFSPEAGRFAGVVSNTRELRAMVARIGKDA